MNDRILDFSEQPASLSIRNGLLVIRLAAQQDRAATASSNSEHAVIPAHSVIPAKAGIHPEPKPDACPGDDDEPRAPQEQTIPLDDIAVLVAALRRSASPWRWRRGWPAPGVCRR